MLAAHSREHVDCVSRVVRNADRLPQAPVPSLIFDSWRRSMEQHHLDPGSLQGPRILSEPLLRECRERADLFMRIASEEVGQLHHRVRHADYCVMLTDAQGQTIDHRVDTSIRNDCRKAGLYLGTCWSEAEEGTCGVATVLTSQSAVTVHKRDHFRAAFIGLTCSAAPIFDPQGNLLGVMDASALKSPDDRRSQHLVRQMVAQSAQAIENAFFMHSARQHWVLQAHSTPGYVDSQPDLLLAWDQDGRLHALNSKARQALRRRFGQVPEHIGEVFDLDALRAVTHDATQQLPWLGEPGVLHVRVNAPRRKPARAAVIPLVDARVEEHLRLALRVKNRNLPVLVQGETGAGKEVFARQLHERSARHTGPFVAVNCAAIPENLIESELFGYVAGAFTGASSKGMPGLLVQADGGTLFLDEIGDMPLALQTRLLRVMAEGEVAPLGAAKTRAVDIHVICASHRDLSVLVSEGRFREDLFFRLGCARFCLPPLRERTDKLALINRLLEQEARNSRVSVGIAPSALQLLLGYAWPGNVRQLRHVLAYACAVCEGGTVQVADLPVEVRGEQVAAPTEDRASPERQVVLDALIRHRWKPLPTAQALGISRATLYRRVNQLGIDMPGKPRH
ncbi:sigma-54-dependent Fis family transcriptional regulator [Pseudomonas simiae]|jgi:transcriptional regulator of acetoin/glycerol metabolism|uniref:sigma-54-dependent Fis family transcriptional regulator n=1 Tax=Pseudomonas simiae TaxID=321846 RepID=UPI0005C3DFE9|nr:sigma-54-dependent Fis family transcriptional regulator [Pseudomonas simiae]VVN92253.1 Acetoin catabolism regulatory protein [Pseudomonas fluorescens]AJP51915.1 acetoin catabolism regulatory protein [Pseudomonas simiae]MBC3966617.1 sigma-54-dependent Fis family transcriptional regulator [Pseudomonas simiae]MBI6613582.1 sigma-54-dependent Fis family transcriptional regulator [Pseudomonas simiae]UNK68690.1 sigma-54-dependent Fis family transcriptional regulator [Pseudomonas simiae]